MQHTNWDARITEEMTVEPLTVRPHAELRSVAALLSTRHISGVPVVNGDGYVIGMISTTDLVRFLVQRGDLKGKVQDAMTTRALSLPVTATVGQAAAIMATEGIHRLPILSKDGRILGIATTMDVTRWVAKNEGLLPNDENDQ